MKIQTGIFLLTKLIISFHHCNHRTIKMKYKLNGISNIFFRANTLLIAIYLYFIGWAWLGAHVVLVHQQLRHGSWMDLLDYKEGVARF